MKQYQPKPQSFIEKYSITDADFEEKVLQSEVPVLLFFRANWAAPCNAMLPVVEELAREYPENQMRIFTIDTDENTSMTINDQNPKVTSSFTVRAIPCFVFFKGGKPLGFIEGAASKSPLDREIHKLFNLRPALPSKQNPSGKTGPARDPK
ncbi:MAG: thioredoxin domain-containing protein [Alphaproteobacteria bacterium]|nr:thioredoxin domain-containing protein [Alphaproteobacteria bacterium]